MKYSRNSCLSWLIQFDFEIRRILNVTACIAWLMLQFFSVFFRRPRLGMPSYMEELFTTSGWYLRANPSQNDRFHRFRRLICICISTYPQLKTQCFHHVPYLSRDCDVKKWRERKLTRHHGVIILHVTSTFQTNVTEETFRFHVKFLKGYFHLICVMNEGLPFQ